MNQASIVSLATAIRTQEGWFPGSLSQRNNNPGNLRLAGQAGAVQGEGGFAAFPSVDAGFQALQNQIALDASRGLTVSQFISKFAPPSENDTSAYLQSITAQTGFASGQTLSSLDSGASGGDTSGDSSGALFDGTDTAGFVVTPAQLAIGVVAAAALAYVVFWR